MPAASKGAAGAPAPAAGPAPMEGAQADQQLHDALYGDPAKLTQPINTVQDKFQLLPAFLKVRRPLGTAPRGQTRWL